MVGLSAWFKWLLAGVCFAWLFAVLAQSCPAICIVPAVVLVIWALLGPFALSWCLIDLSGWAFHNGYYRLARSLSAIGVQVDNFVRPLVVLVGFSDSPLAVFNSLNLANSEMVSGQFVSAKERLNLALKQADCLPGIGVDATTPLILSHLASVEHYLGDFEQAHCLLTRSVNLKSNCLADSEGVEKLGLEQAIAADRHAFGCFYEKRLAMAEAEKNYLAAMDILNRAAAVNADCKMQSDCEWESDMRGNFTNVLGEFYLRQGRIDDAEPLLRQAFALRSKRFKANHPIMSASYECLGKLAMARGDLAEARRQLTLAHKIKLRYCRENVADLGDTLKSLAQLDFLCGRQAEAESQLVQALAAKEKVFGSSYPDVADILETQCLVLAGKPERASEVAALQERARAIRQRFALK